MTIPEYDNIAPQEDWTAGLPVVLRGIQTESWAEVAQGIIISLEQVENYPKESGREDAPEKEWRNRHKGIAEEEAKNMKKWMPEDLMNMARRSAKRTSWKISGSWQNGTIKDLKFFCYSVSIRG